MHEYRYECIISVFVFRRILFRRAVVEELAKFGAKVHTCSRNQEELNACLNDWKANGLVVSGSVCDASVRDQREKLIQEASSAFSGKLNILVSSLLLQKFVVFYTLEESSPNLEIIYRISRTIFELICHTFIRCLYLFGLSIEMVYTCGGFALNDPLSVNSIQVI